MKNITIIYLYKNYLEINVRNYLLKLMINQVKNDDNYVKIEVTIFDNNNNEFLIISSIIDINVDTERFIFAKKVTKFLTNVVNKLAISTFTICYKFSQSNLDEFKEYTKSLKINKPNNNNKFHTKTVNTKRFNWKWLLFVLLLIIVVLYKTNLINLNDLILLNKIINNAILLKYLVLTLMVVCLLLVLYFVLNIIILYLFKTNKINNSIFLPPFVSSRLDFFDKIIKNEQLPLIIDYYYKHVYIYISFFFISVFNYFLIITFLL